MSARYIFPACEYSNMCACACRCRVGSLTPAETEQRLRTSNHVHKTPPADLEKHITDGFSGADK